MIGDFTRNPCKGCAAPDLVKDTLGCAADRLQNAFEDFKADAFGKVVRIEPKYQCRMWEVFNDEDERN